MSEGQENVSQEGMFGAAYNLHSVSTSRMDVCGDRDENMNVHLHEGMLRRTRSFPDCSDPSDESNKIMIGICAMDKKARSNPMNEIVKRLVRNGDFEVEIFGDETILNKDVDEWPECDCLLSWHSEGFPTEKALRYCEKQKPLLVNDLAKQPILFDRRRVYDVLQKAKIPVPNHVIIDRDHLKEGEEVEGLIEEEDFFEYQGKRMYKPFVEKPASGDDHNIFVYYPQPMVRQDQGGGVKKLFRKIDNKSAEYNPDHPGTIRRKGSYVYEEFLTTGGTDVKVYTVGPAYAHAEARKSPVVDGKVLRTKQGKEVRFPVLLSPAEKEIARLVTIAFGQKVCGFDLLRSDKGSFVCDVNGWSFVKSSYKYYDDAAGILRTIILASLAPHRLQMRPIKPHAESPDFKRDGTKSQISETLSFDDLSPLDGRHTRMMGDTDPREELRCVLAVIRHGDRTPKQKMKIKVTQPAMLELFDRYKDAKCKQAKLKAPNQLQELLDVTRTLLREMQGRSNQGPETKVEKSLESKSSISDVASEKYELCEKFRIVVSVLEAGGHFSGINRKVQLKPLRWSQNVDPPKVEEVLLILKHGGVLTHAGRKQAETLGSHFRQVMYPSAGSGTAGGGLLRLHSTYRHDLKIYSSDEGRVQTSAAAFTKGLLALEGSSLTPILASLVKKDTQMLDSFDKGASENIQRSKVMLYEQVTWNEDKHVAAFTPPTGATPVPSPSPCGSPVPTTDKESTDSDSSPLQTTIPRMPDNPLQLLRRMVELMQVLKDDLLERCRREGGTDRRLKVHSSLSQDPREWEAEKGHPCSGERILLTYDRWRKLLKSFYNTKKDQFDISKVSDIYDSVKYDAIHNQQMELPIEELYNTAKVLATVVVPNEYGVTPKDKLLIGSRICSQLLGKLLADLGNTREESRMTSHSSEREIFGNERFPGTHVENEPWCKGMGNDLYAPNIGSKDISGGGSNSEADDEGEPETFHRLSPSYALNINSPLRHVRTRIYFTSESHIHGLINVLRHGHLDCNEESTSKAMLSDDQENALLDMPEFDYLTHIVFRMFENVQIPADDPNRFRIEISFSPGSGYNPVHMQPWLQDHTLPIIPRCSLLEGEGITLETLAQLLVRYAEPRKLPQSMSWLTSIPNKPTT